jgi:hypothetical protein
VAALLARTAPTVVPDRARYLQRMSDSDGDDEITVGDVQVQSSESVLPFANVSAVSESYIEPGSRQLETLTYEHGR